MFERTSDSPLCRHCLACPIRTSCQWQKQICVYKRDALSHRRSANEMRSATKALFPNKRTKFLIVPLRWDELHGARCQQSLFDLTLHAEIQNHQWQEGLAYSSHIMPIGHGLPRPSGVPFVFPVWRAEMVDVGFRIELNSGPSRVAKSLFTPHTLTGTNSDSRI
jgi:hypothetical protein